MRLPLSALVPPQVRHGLKTGFAVVLAYLVTQIFGLHMWQWAVVSAVVAMQMTVADAIQSGVNRITGTIIGAALGMGILMITPSGNVWFGMALWLGAALCASLSQYSPRYTMAAMTVVVVLLAGADETDKIAVGIGRMMEIGIGVGSSLFVSVVLWPVRMADKLRRDLAAQYVECAAHLNTLVSAFLNRQQALDYHMLEPLVDKAWNNHELYLRVRKHESLVYQYDHDVLKVQVHTLDRSVSDLKPMLEALNDYEEPQGFDVIMAPELRRLADAIMATLRHLGGSTPAAPVPDLVRTMTELVDITEKRLDQLRNEGATNRLNLHQMLQFYTFFHSLRGLATDLLFALDRIQKRRK
ncbi:FUSC family protein [Desulfovibrio sp. OttesenSCG-928-O18]|nr:FUSC family protein [Desulfovibrio sp. OttesenSCG-928-O18]